MLRQTLISLTLVAPLFAVPAHASEPDRAVVAEQRDALRLQTEPKKPAELNRHPATGVAQTRGVKSDSGPGDLSPAAQPGRHPEPSHSAAPDTLRAPDTPPDALINRVISIFR